MPDARFRARWLFRQQQPVFGDRSLEIHIFRRIEYVESASNNADGRLPQRTLMGRRIDTLCQSRYNGDTRLYQTIGKVPGKAACSRRGVSCADHGDGWTFQKLQPPAPDQCRWRIAEFRQKSRIGSVAEEEKPGAKFVNRLHFRDDLLLVSNPRRPSAAPCSQIGDSLQRARCGAISSDQLLICNGSDILGSDKPEPVKRFLAFSHSLQTFLDAPTFGSSPAIRRSIFERCFHKTSSASPMNMGIMLDSPNTKAAIGTDMAASIPPTDE